MYNEEEGRPKGRKNLSKFFLSCNKVWILFHNINTFISDIFFCKHFFNEIQVFVLRYILNSLVYFIIKLHIVWIFFPERPEIYKNSDFLSEFFCDPFVSKKIKNTWITSSVFSGAWDVHFIWILKRKQWKVYWSYNQLGWKEASQWAQWWIRLPVQETQTRVWFLGRENPLRREWPPTPVFLTGKFHRQRTLAG